MLTVPTVTKIAGVVVLGIFFWHFHAVWGLVADCGIALIVLP